jgi:hypothetical protein
MIGVGLADCYERLECIGTVNLVLTPPQQKINKLLLFFCLMNFF